jgi:hypothetical protein
MSNNNELLEIQQSINYTLENVVQRGWLDKSNNADIFAKLRQNRSIRDAQIEALYEEYFLPDRHEHEWQLLTDIVGTIINSPVLEFSTLAIASGVIGNAAYDILKSLCTYTARQYSEKLGEKAHERADGFQQIANDAEKLKLFFIKQPKARILEIEESTGLTREKIYPLMKIAGFTHHKRGDTTCYWEVP